MKADITTLPIGTKFKYNGELFEVEDRSEYPFIQTRCITEPNEYDGLGVMFTNFEKVDVPDGTNIIEHVGHVIVHR